MNPVAKFFVLGALQSSQEINRSPLGYSTETFEEVNKEKAWFVFSARIELKKYEKKLRLMAREGVSKHKINELKKRIRELRNGLSYIS